MKLLTHILMFVCPTLALIVQTAPTNLAESTRPASFSSFSSKESNEPSSEFRNTSSILLIDDRDIFNMGYNNITFIVFNNGTIQIAPCGNWSGFEFQVSASACDIIILDVRNGTVVRDNARAEVRDGIPVFQVYLGNITSAARTNPANILNTPYVGIAVGIVFGVFAFILVLMGVVWWHMRQRK